MGAQDVQENSSPQEDATELQLDSIKNKEQWDRSGDALKDFLFLYKTGVLYDCTFLVKQSDDPNDQFVFKCHKLVLSIASPVFETMFNGNFSESKREVDEEIVIHNTSPKAFDAAMKFIYGRELNFGDVMLASEIYTFAHFWQIDSLMTAVEKYLGKPTPENVCKIYDMYQTLNSSEEKLQKSMEVILVNTSEIFSSSFWKTVSLDTVVDILNQDRLNVAGESVLIESLIQWGKAQLDDPDDVNVGPKLREVIDQPLKLIRFFQMDMKEFSALCTTTLSNILTVEEKYAILLSMSMDSREYLPEGFSKKSCREGLHQNATTLDLKTSYYNNGSREDFWFKTDKSVYILGFKFIKFNHYDASFEPSSAFFQLQDEKGNLIGSGSTESRDSKRNYFTFRKPVLLQANVNVQLQVKISNLSLYYTQQNFNAVRYDVQLNDRTIVTINLLRDASCAGIAALVLARS
ncbi:BTB/POZ domain-containing protein 2-like isoform X1 [Cloeon dipterum]|uniref:BTB/POZ domain-containing protein 2-like isoform X1 n=1 Tax=Cloeon dipterum TaxID=197152 RepID=UPI00321FD20E